MTKRLLTLLCLGLSFSSIASARSIVPPPYVQPVKEKDIEIVFVIDTTGSMGGLIQGAKTKVWSIINDVMQNQKQARVKVGLVAYRDRGDTYVTQVTPLSSDLDQIYSQLMDFKAQGGGDTPEDVRMALRDAVTKTGWSTQKNKNTSQIIFLVGDAPAHNDYKDVPDVIETIKQAKKMGIIVNSIQCGSAHDTAEQWRTIAQYGGGEYFAIAQTGGTVTINTPYDEKLIQLNNNLGRVYIPMGSASARSEAYSTSVATETKFKSAPIEAQAERAKNKSINSGAFARDDLIQAIENKVVNVKTIKTENLPENMQKMSVSERESYIKQQIKERDALKEEIRNLSKERDVYITKQKSERGSQDSFDSAVSNALNKQVK